MLPPLFPKDTKESETKSNHEAKKPQERTSVKHSYQVMSSSLWVLSGIFLSVFSGLILLVWGIFALISSGDPVTASANNQDQYLGGQVYGSWAEQEMSDDANPPFNAQQLYGRLQAELKKYPELSAGITIAPVGGGKQVRINDDKQFTAASTTKVLTAIAVLDGVDKGKYSLSQIAYQIFPKTEKDAEKDNSKNTDADSNSKPSATPTPSNTPTPSPTPTPTPTPVPKKVQLKEALRLMVNRSDNQAWEHLIMLVGSKNLQKYAENMGMQDYNVRNNQSSPRDLALMLQKLYSNKLLTENSTKLLLGWMHDTNEEMMIPAGIDEAGAVYHKYGWLGSNLHDIAIVDNNGNPVVVVIMTEGSKNHSEGKTVIRTLAELVEQELKK